VLLVQLLFASVTTNQKVLDDQKLCSTKISDSKQYLYNDRLMRKLRVTK